MPLIQGSRIGPYEVQSPLGEGGMGEVYRARDVRLQRDVAIKVLPDRFANDAERLSRFQREAQVLASLNHPNIAQIHGFEVSGATQCIVMELVDGETLADQIKRGPLPVNDVVAVAKQICEALEAAHEKGIIHRDLKPANIKITPDGKVKLLDFGLARLFDTDTGSIDAANSPTIGPTMMSVTGGGVILGTAAYMSPEQARGKVVDKRTDIWSFGCVVYEALTGIQIFAGETVSDSIARILEREPDWSKLPPATPPGIGTFLHRALQKDRRNRLRDVGDARIEIEEVYRAPALTTETAATTKSRNRLAWSVAGMLALIAIAAMAGWIQSIQKPVPELPAVRFTVPPPEKVTAVFGAAISPDGKKVAFFANDAPSNRRIFWRPLDSLAARPLDGTSGNGQLFWSPDGRFIGFFAGDKLKKVEVASGAVQTVCDLPARNFLGATWNQNGVILLGSGGHINRVDSAGGRLVLLPAFDKPDTVPGFPHFLPDGQRFIYGEIKTGNNVEYLIGSLESKETQRLPGIGAVRGDPVGVIYSSGRLLWIREGTLTAQAFDVKSLQLSGEPFPIAEAASSFQFGSIDSFSASDNGALVYLAQSARPTRLTWFNRSGQRLSEESVDGLTQAPNLSRDGKRVAYERTDATGKRDIWALDLMRGINMRITLNGGASRPVFSPDGAQIIFSVENHLFQKSSGGTGPEERIGEGEPTDWSADGQHIISFHDSDLWDLPVSGDRKEIPIVNGKGNDRRGRLSPDGKWIAYESNEAGRFEIYVQRFPPTKERWQVSANGGDSAWWRSDGKELFFNGGGKLMAVDVKFGAAFDASPPHALFDLPGAINNGRFIASLDGQRFLLPIITQDAEAAPLTVVLNWPAGMKK